MFNLKKLGGKDKALGINEKQLKKERKDFGTAADPDGGTTDHRLESLRKNQKGDETTQLQLDEVRLADQTNQKTTDGQLAHHKSPEGFVPTRTNTEETEFHGLPINELAEARDEEYAKALADADYLDAGTKFWDKTFGKEQCVGQAPSQLNCNVTAAMVASDAKLREMVVASLMDADAMLYHIYRTAASDSRELNAAEKYLVDGITQDKIRIATALGVG